MPFVRPDAFGRMPPRTPSRKAAPAVPPTSSVPPQPAPKAPAPAPREKPRRRDRVESPGGGWRERINTRPLIASGLAAVFAFVPLIYLCFYLFAGDDDGKPDLRNAQVYYTTDDGATFTPGPASDRMDPNRVIAHVYSVDSGKTLFVGYLERWLPSGVEAWKKLDAAIHANDGAEALRLQPDVDGGREVKKPGPGPWINSAAPEAEEIKDPKGPNGEVTVDEVAAPMKSEGSAEPNAPTKS